MEKVIVAFESEKNCQHIKSILEAAGVASGMICRTAAEVRRLVQKQHITAVVCGFKLSDDSSVSLFHDLPSYCSMLLIANQNQLEFFDEPDIFTLSSPVGKNSLIMSVRMMLQVGHRMEKFSRPQRSAEDCQLIDRAKILLIERHGMSEEQAHKLLQKRSMDSGAKLSDTARMVLSEQ